jgi:hypothetical protein
MTEILRNEGLAGVTRIPVPENLSSLARCCVHLHIQLLPTVYLDCLISEHGVNMLNRNVANKLPTSAQESEGVNCISEEAWNLARVKRFVSADCICQWKINLRDWRI